jgi:hypothetical protein
MTQSGWIAAALIVGFVLWLAMNDRLQSYWSLLIGGGAAPAAGGTSSATSSPASATKTPAALSPSASLNQWLGSFFPNDPILRSLLEHTF